MTDSFGTATRNEGVPSQGHDAYRRSQWEAAQAGGTIRSHARCDQGCWTTIEVRWACVCENNGEELCPVCDGMPDDDDFFCEEIDE